VALLWELAIKQSIGKLKVDGDLREHLRLQSFTELPVLGEHALAVRDLPPHHRDSFDRLLIAQARCEGLRSLPLIVRSPLMTCRSCRSDSAQSFLGHSSDRWGSCSGFFDRARWPV
jgi:hypothetical protein